MRCLSILLMFGSFCIPVSSQAADTPLHRRINVEYHGISLRDALHDIGTKAGVRFDCNDTLLQSTDPITIRFQECEAGRVVLTMLRPYGLTLERLEGSAIPVVKRDWSHGLRAERESVFEFETKPELRVDGDSVTIRFTTKGWCDATVVIEDSNGRIVRPLASGVLGPWAPEPFLWNSKKQVLVWDGKNDKGQYIDDRAGLHVRVSLGLRARYERNLMWCPKKRGPTTGGSVGRFAPLVAAAPEGVYVYDGEFVGERVCLYDHDGNYVRTVFPFSAATVKTVPGVKLHPLSGPLAPSPLRWHQQLVTTLTAAHRLYGGDWPVVLGKEEGYGQQIQAMAVRGERLALVGWRINRLGTDGAGWPGGLALSGPPVTYPAKLRSLHEFRGGEFEIVPRSAAIDPKGEWLYLTGYAWVMPWNQDGLHGVVRVRLDGDAPPELFAGSMKQNEWGQDENRLSFPLSVTCDSRGRVYVCDHMNDRIQIFSEKGELLKTVITPRPVHLEIDPRTGELFVFSWLVGNDRLVREIDALKALHERQKPVPPLLTRYPGIDWSKPERQLTLPPIASYPISLDGIGTTARPYYGVYMSGLQHRVCVDFWGKEPVVWVSEGSRNDTTWKGNIRLYGLGTEGLRLVRDFGTDVEKEDPQPRPPYHGRQRLYFDHKNRKLYVGEQFLDPLHIKSFWETIQIDPETGHAKIVHLPFDCEDMAFDMDGHAYLRTLTQIVRYDATSWREVPFDYGEEKMNVTYSQARGGRAAKVVASAIESRLESNSSSQFYGMWVSPKDYVVVTGCHREPAATRTDEKDLSSSAKERYEPRIYPGRPWGSLVHIFDRHGKLVYDDALPGSNYFQGIAMDRDDNLYIQHSGMPPGADGKYPADMHRGACTLIKLKPGSRFIKEGGTILPLSGGARPRRAPDFLWQGTSPVWIEGFEWMYGGVGLSTKASSAGDCHCFGNSRFGFDWLGRSFVAELDRHRITVLDSNGNVVLRIGRYGNADDGVPLIAERASPAARSISGDEVALALPLFLAVETDRRLFVADIGNYRIMSVKLDYCTEERVPVQTAGR
ncbi:MAG: hypothetical protein N2255_05195 [Kiritimatiellae bacterium]|nr:hypothetical protein [Kiritimatiellia bacterium]